MTENEYKPSSYPPERRPQNKTTTVVEMIGGTAFGLNAAEKFSNGQTVLGTVLAVTSVAFLTEPVIYEWTHRRKVKKYNQSKTEE